MEYSENISAELKGIIAIYDSRIKFHPIKNGLMQPERAPFKKDLMPLTRLINSDGDIPYFKFNSIIPKNVLSFKTDEAYIIWNTKPKYQNLLFDKNLPMKSGSYPIPSLVWVYKNNELNVFAVKDLKITENTKLYQAPFLNIDNTGNVCMGNAMIKKINSDYQEAILQIETHFFNSYFTHTNTDNLLKRSITDVYLEQAEIKTKQFNNKLLLSLELTINDII